MDFRKLLAKGLYRGQKFQLTEKKVKELKRELKELETKGRKEIADRLDWLRSLPNAREDTTFSEVLDDKNYLENRINELKEILSNYEISNEKKHTNIVEIGSEVEVGFEGYEAKYKIVSALEADPLNNKISDESPVGKALLGSRAGDIVYADTGVAKKKFRVLKVS
ncbi:GreA/GreB family elongation factor [Candidatus Nomurabacteria bacterium]|nr:GreA/GreB family elongation factor [Candidatus Nomurabacteria bacterium]